MANQNVIKIEMHH